MRHQIHSALVDAVRLSPAGNSPSVLHHFSCRCGPTWVLLRPQVRCPGLSKPDRPHSPDQRQKTAQPSGTAPAAAFFNLRHDLLVPGSRPHDGMDRQPLQVYWFQHLFLLLHPVYPRYAEQSKGLRTVKGDDLLRRRRFLSGLAAVLRDQPRSPRTGKGSDLPLRNPCQSELLRHLHGICPPGGAVLLSAAPKAALAVLLRTHLRRSPGQPLQGGLAGIAGRIPRHRLFRFKRARQTVCGYKIEFRLAGSDRPAPAGPGRPAVIQDPDHTRRDGQSGHARGRCRFLPHLHLGEGIQAVPALLGVRDRPRPPHLRQNNHPEPRPGG